MGDLHETCLGTERAQAAWAFLRLWGRAVDGIIEPGWIHRYTEREIAAVEFVARQRLVEWAPYPGVFECQVPGCRGICGAALKPTPAGLDILASVEAMRATRAL